MTFNRQAQFRPDGTQTDVPTAKTEAPPVLQLSWLIVLDKEAFDRRAKEDSGSAPLTTSGIVFSTVTETSTDNEEVSK